MRHRHRPTAGDLLAKTRNDAAGASENVAETDNDELGRAILQALADHFSHALRCAHHVGRIDSLVSRHEHEFLDARGNCSTREHPRAPGVVAYRLPGIA